MSNLPTDEEILHAVRVLQDACYGRAKNNGWWLNKDGTPFTSNPLAFSNKLMLIVSEVSESMEGDRKNKLDDHLPHRPMREVELADALIRILDVAGGFNLDIAGAVVEKMNYNDQRADHKVENRAKDGGKAY